MPADPLRELSLLRDLLRGLVARPSPAGSEAAIAGWFAGWAAKRWPWIDWHLDPFDGARANVVGRSVLGRAPSLLFYSHLDTSLSGDPRWDRFVLGTPPPPARARFAADVVRGPGVAVAKGPAAAATVGFVTAVEAARRAGRSHDLTLLLAAGGTHRARPPATDLDPGAPASGAAAGIRRYLAGARPAAAVVAKAGPEGLLYEEPGAAFFVVRVTGDWAPVMSHARVVPDGGVPAMSGLAVDAVEQWRRCFVERPLPAGSQVGREVGVGALRCGVPYKSDLFGSVLELYVYAVTGPGDDPVDLAQELTRSVEGALRRERRHCSVAVELLEATAAARTDPRRRIGRAARTAWKTVMGGSPAAVRGWTGSTDGVLLRQAGVDTVRVGPPPLATRSGQEALRWSELRSHADLYAEVAKIWTT